MDITITLRCNNDCFFCPRKDYLKMISWSSIRQGYKDIENTRKASDKIVLSGGEVTILKELWRVISFCKKMRFKTISIITNGRNLKDLSFAERLILAGVNDFAVSIYSVNERIHDFITRSSGSCKETKQGIINLIKLSSRHNIFLRVNIVLSYWNFKDVHNTLKTLFSWGIKNFILAEQIILDNKLKHLNSRKIVRFLKDIRQIDLPNARLCLRGFAPCFIEDIEFQKGGESVLKRKDPIIILERQEVDTLVECKNKKKYIKKFCWLFTNMKNCISCTLQKDCPGIQKAYILKS